MQLHEYIRRSYRNGSSEQELAQWIVAAAQKSANVETGPSESDLLEAIRDEAKRQSK